MRLTINLTTSKDKLYKGEVLLYMRKGGKLRVKRISTENQVADIMTKPLSKTRLQSLCNKMGLCQSQFVLIITDKRKCTS